MNRDCFGQSFKVDGRWYWRCLGDSSIIEIAPADMTGKCPSCGSLAEPDIIAIETRVVVVQEVRPVGSITWLDFKKEIF